MTDRHGARWFGAAVALCGGKRLGWKVVGGYLPSIAFSHNHVVAPGLICEVVQQSFDTAEAAEAWCASFEAHPDEDGWVPQRRTCDGECNELHRLRQSLRRIAKQRCDDPETCEEVRTCEDPLCRECAEYLCVACYAREALKRTRVHKKDSDG